MTQPSNKCEEAERWSPTEWKKNIRSWGLGLGFSQVGFATTEVLPEFARLEEWLALGFHGEMKWMARDPRGRCDPNTILPSARSCIVVALPYYYSDPEWLHAESPRISRYAWGEDYHEVVGAKLRALECMMREYRPSLRSRIACDTSPVMDKSWAQRAGIGWLGKNTCLIHPGGGSWFFLGEVFVDFDLPPDIVIQDHCGTCDQCMRACPTGALVAPRVLDSRRCISYLTIERRGDWSEDEEIATGNWLAGCDVCQEVCPYNRAAAVASEPRFLPRPDLLLRTGADWERDGDEAYRQRVKNSALRRIKPEDMRRNARAVNQHRSGPR